MDRKRRRALGGKPREGRLVAEPGVDNAALDRLAARIDNREILHRIDTSVIRLEGKVEASNLRLENMTKTVYGNGIPGLKTDVDRLVQESANRLWERRALWGTVLAALIGQVIVLLNMYVFHAE